MYKHVCIYVCTYIVYVLHMYMYMYLHSVCIVCTYICILCMYSTCACMYVCTCVCTIHNICTAHAMHPFYCLLHISVLCAFTPVMYTGGSLDQYGTIPEQVLGRIAVGVVRGLSYLSSLKIMHRGLSGCLSNFETPGEAVYLLL